MKTTNIQNKKLGTYLFCYFVNSESVKQQEQLSEEMEFFIVDVIKSVVNISWKMIQISFRSYWPL